jgi:hypothetical protein
MNPRHKTIMMVVGSMIGLFLIPAILILLRDYLLAIIFITSCLAFLLIFSYAMYTELYSLMIQEQIDDDDAFHQFNGDPNKIHFYKGFKKYFKGELSAEGLEKWFENHPTKH